MQNADVVIVYEQSLLDEIVQAPDANRAETIAGNEALCPLEG